MALTVSPNVLESEFAQAPASRPLRVTCYGSSSSLTPPDYLRDAFDVGYLLAVRGHVCVNGAGSYGCMAALNDGAAAGNGHIVGVIHEMWLMDGENAASAYGKRNLRDGGAHPVFGSSSSSSDGNGDEPATATESRHGGPHPALSRGSSNDDNNSTIGRRHGGPIREMLVARGKDLQERKRLLVENADALIVLPGGPGTWDELWEMACARNIGLTSLPIVCVNTNGYYGSFLKMLERAYQDQLTKLRPEEILHFEETAEGAVRWIEEAAAASAAKVGVAGDLGKAEQRAKARVVLRSSSVLSSPSLSWFASAYRRASSWVSEPPVSLHGPASDNRGEDLAPLPSILGGGVWFGLGIAAGLALSSYSKHTGR
jgi:predicted Rossmann-fold nucleotide-binding protein